MRECRFLSRVGYRRQEKGAARERGACFYCLRRSPAKVQCPDHVVPRVRFGRNSYRNLVSCCLECNSRKVDMAARDFLRVLYRKERLTAAELDGRLRALKDLAAGKLRPSPDFENRK
jgi:5-methylcytosine-specific restriction endonuclease McrA